MAGSYPDAPFRRMAYDEDGTVFWAADTTAQTHTSTILPGTEYNATQKGWFNNERTLIHGAETPIGPGSFVSGNQGWSVVMVFPEARDVYGTNFWSTATFITFGDPNGRNKPNDFQYSTDSPNGISGTWIDLFGGITYPITAPWLTYSWDHWYRIAIVSSSPFPVMGVRSLRWIASAGEGLLGDSHWHHIHVYGDKSTGATPDRLLFIDDDTGLEFTGPLDWGDVPRGTVLFHDIKVKNNSATLTANTILLDFEALTGLSDQWHTMSDSGGAYAGTVNITIAIVGPRDTIG